MDSNLSDNTGSHRLQYSNWMSKYLFALFMSRTKIPKAAGTELRLAFSHMGDKNVTLPTSCF